jgi:PPOX class probable F420-dependent enzyme
MPGKQSTISAAVRRKLRQARVARFATLDAQGRPHIVPICFAYVGSVLYTAIDKKPKRVSPERLVRVRNLSAEPHVALLLDEYEEDWGQLWYVLLRGRAKLLPRSAHKERVSALRNLRAKYPQYARGMLTDDAPIVRISLKRATSWGKI